MTRPPHPGSLRSPRLASGRLFPAGPFWVLALVCAALALSGCAQLQGGLTTLSPSTLLSSRPEPEGVYLPSTSARVFGRCWNATYAEVSTWTRWRGGDHVPCTDDHTTYTYAAEDLPDGLVANLDAAESERASLALQDDVDEAVAEICGAEFSYLFPTRTERQILVRWFSFLPTPAEWDEGARWVRCDVAVYALTTTTTEVATIEEPQASAGTPVPASHPSAPELLLLPDSVHDLTDAVAQRPADYEYCLDDVGSGVTEGPRHSTTAVTANCRDDPLWTYLGSETLDTPRGSPFPGDADVYTAAQTACDDASLLRGEGPHQGWIYYPSEEGWNQGSRIVQCWSTT